ncbi:ACP phosphodiesterase [Zobellella aerophila]|uniref:ACP phosphodiesterase n=1 Tax=Zobellella aerophila TaxID=870480 RepID=A0ABP6V021_9GAMM
MNYLAHLHLAHISHTSLPGALLGEFARGAIDPNLPAELQTGIRLHRQIDSFTDLHPRHLGAVRALPSPFRRFGGIIMDMMFDHFLARHWQQYHAWPLPDFIGYSHSKLQPDGHWPDPLVTLVERIKQYQLLQQYATLPGITLALERMDSRFRRPTPLPRCGPLLVEHYDAMEQAFLAFYPDLISFVLEQAGSAR